MFINKRTALLLVADVAATYLAYFLSSLLTNVLDEVFTSHEIYFVIGVLALINIMVLALFRLYNNLWEYASIDEAVQIMLALMLSTLGGAVVLWAIGDRLPIRVSFAAWLMLTLFCGGVRALFRVMPLQMRKFAAPVANQPRPRSLIVGAGETGSLVINRMLSKDPLMPGIPLLAVDDNREKRGQRIHGIKVEGTSADIEKLVEAYGIEQIVVAIPSATLNDRKRIYDICTRTDCKLRTLPNVRELRVDELDDVALRDVDVADLLGRDEVMLNTRSVSGYITGKTVLVTGGGGSIGSELCRQVCTVAPERVVIFDVYENDAYMLRNELLSEYFDIDIVIEIGSVCDESRLRDVFQKHHPSVVFHAAAHKHVPLMEACPREALHNNVFGTLNTVRIADEFGVKRFIFISTDKAVNPTSVMGATKRFCEMIVCSRSGSVTHFAAVRFGNVIGSNGSVVPLFKKQIENGGPVTVTDKRVVRYFMTVSEAAELVLEAGAMAHRGELYVLDMGNPVKIWDIAVNMISLAGLEAGRDIEIKEIGLRPGEKLYEELLVKPEQVTRTENSLIFIEKDTPLPKGEVEEKLEKLREAVKSGGKAVTAALKKAVPTFAGAEKAE